ncbi:hypothetical protein CRU86_01645 [Aliarcobacter skirrowii]|uniref:hypothetical protein n=1 Tax=Aliarcobacter skirrowii TaxID=28200 RepID=UPI00100A3F54|nr:hypothetical protein [Aliarcobacter skirrowii]RXJ80128.1 hypothetical protein CRU86_01645 [Aliarcobacter skirrowii]
MQIQNNQTIYYGYNQNSNSVNENSSSNSFDINLKNEEDTKKPTSKMIEYLEKKGKFSSLSKEDETLFRDILEDGVFSASEMKRLSYEQMQVFSDMVNFAKNYNEDNPTSKDDFPPYLLSTVGTYLSSEKTNNDSFNKALYETVKNIQNDKDRMAYLDAINSALGFNDNQGYGQLPKHIIDNMIKELNKLEKEKYKDFENPENLIKDYNNWEIKDYKAFIDNLKNSYKTASVNSALSIETRAMYQMLYQNTLILEENYNQIQKETKYANTK